MASKRARQSSAAAASPKRTKAETSGLWLLKSEPDAFSLADLRDSTGGVGPWDGVRNAQARCDKRARARARAHKEEEEEEEEEERASEGASERRATQTHTRRRHTLPPPSRPFDSDSDFDFPARNLLKSMRVGDRAFFYHSSCKVLSPSL